MAVGGRGGTRGVDGAPRSDTDQRRAESGARDGQAKSTTHLELGRDDFPLDGLAAKLDDVVDVLLDGRGFARIATLDTERYGDDDLTLLYWGIGTAPGWPWAQNKYGHVLGDVTDQGKTIDDPTVRGNELGGIALHYHCDGSDLVGLLCLRRTGRRARRASPTRCAIHNRARVGVPRPGRRALPTDCPTTPEASRPRGQAAFYCVPGFTEWAIGCSSASSLRTSSPRNATPTRPG